MIKYNDRIVHFLLIVVLAWVLVAGGWGQLYAEEVVSTGDEQVVQDQEKINIQIEEETSKTFPGLKKFLNTRDHVILVSLTKKNTLSITGLHVGVSYLYLWLPEGRRVYKVTVRIKDLPKSSVQERMEREVYSQDNFKLEYVFAGNWSKIHDKITDEKHTSRDDTWHYLTLAGKTPYGEIRAHGKFEYVDSDVEVPERTLSFIDFTVGPLPIFTLDLGHSHTYFSQFVMSSVTIDGANFQTRPFSDDFYLNLVWGQQEAPHLGSLTSDIETKDYNLWGVRLEYQPLDEWMIAGNVAGGYGDEKEPDAPDQNFGIDVSYQREQFTIDMESGYEEGNHGAVVTGEWLKDYNVVGLQLFDIDEGYHDVIGNVTQQGERGGEAYFTYYPREYLEVKGKSKIYQDRLLAEGDGEDEFNIEAEIGADLTFERTNYGASYNLIKNETTNFPYRLDSIYLSAARSFRFLNRDLRVYTSYQHHRRRGDAAPELNSDRDRLSLGAYVTLSRYLYANAAYDWAWVHELEDDERYEPSLFTAGITATKGFEKLHLTSTFSLLYSKEDSDGSQGSFFVDKERTGVSAGLRYNKGTGFEIYVNGGVERVHDTTTGRDEGKTLEYNVQTGLRFLWDTGIRWDSSAPISGIVFVDLDGSGTYDPGEVGVPNVEVKLLKEKAVMTDAEGKFSFGKVRGRHEFVSVNAQTIPSGYIFTTPEEVKVEISAGRNLVVFFGIRTRCEVNGIVYNDLNMNEVYDYGDLGVSGVKLMLDDKHELYSDADGRFSKPDALPGEHTLRIDLDSLPKDFFIRGKMVEKFRLSEGGFFSKEYALQTIRTVKGAVFVDENNNGYRDLEEQGFANIRVTFNQFETVTDQKGEYRFKELAAGFGKAKIDVNTLPAGYEIDGKPEIGITLPPDAYSVQDINFALKKKL